MALQLEVTAAGTAPRRIVLGEGRTRVIARPAENYRLIDDAGNVADGVTVKRIDNNLVVEGLPEGRELELNNFFGACTPGRDCSLALEALGAPAGIVLTNETDPLAALPDGSFLLYSSEPVPPAIAAAAERGTIGTGGGMSVGTILAAGGGALLIAAAAGGGGGGGDAPTLQPAGDATAGERPAAPSITSAAATRQFQPVVSGRAEPGSTVTLTIDARSDGTEDAVYTTTAAADGSWSVNLATATPSQGTLGAGFADRSDNKLTVTASNANGTSDPTIATLRVEASAPPAPTIAVVAGNDVVNGAERSAGVSVSGTIDPAHAGQPVTVTWGASTLVATPVGTAWTVKFAPEQVPADGNIAITAQYASLAGVASGTGTRAVRVDTVGPAAPAISDNVSASVTNDPVTFTIRFKEPVLGFDASDVGISNGTRSAFTALAPDTYAVTVTPTANAVGSVSVQVAAGAATDAAGNPTTAPAAASQAFDTAPPTQRVTGTSGQDDQAPQVGAFSNGSQINDRTPTLSFTLSSNLAAGETLRVFKDGVDVGAASGSTTNPSFAVTSPLADGSHGFTAQVRDAAGNVGQMRSAITFVVDTVGPAAPVITDNFDDSTGARATGPVTFSFQFAETVFDFRVSDIQITGGSAAENTFTSTANGSLYLLDVVPDSNTLGTMTVQVPAGGATDFAGNPGAGSAVASQDYDTRVLAADDGDPSAMNATFTTSSADDSSLLFDSSTIPRIA